VGPSSHHFFLLIVLYFVFLCFTEMVTMLLQISDSHFEPHKRVRYSRDQLLELREVLVA
jgi:hypothetical protein